ncbi:MAG: hypothetical protein ABGZ35_05270 [Planctomycetaceae bacterium]
MSQSRRTSPWLTATAVVLVLLGAYVGGYFWLGEYHPWLARDDTGTAMVVVHERAFRYRATQLAYYPMGYVECVSRREPVVLRVFDGKQLHKAIFEPQ